jgi:hypothetical protein
MGSAVMSDDPVELVERMFRTQAQTTLRTNSRNASATTTSTAAPPGTSGMAANLAPHMRSESRRALASSLKKLTRMIFP